MRQPRALRLLPDSCQSQTLVSYKPRLAKEQLEALRRCANGISLRFEAWAIITPLVDGGYLEKGVAGVVNMTAKGEEYLQAHAD